MRIHLEFDSAHVWYEDGVKQPTPEHVDDMLIRLGRAFERMWGGQPLEPADLTEYEGE